LIALLASENSSKKIGTALWRDNPRTISPWWIVSNVLVVTALEFRNPMLLFILMKADDPFVHGSLWRLTLQISRAAFWRRLDLPRYVLLAVSGKRSGCSMICSVKSTSRSGQ
jgi:hypothetical protein